MKLQLLIYAIFIYKFHHVITQMIGFGSCPNDLQVVKNFSFTEYLGLWYEQYRYFIIFQLGATCVTANYSQTDEGALGVLNSQYSRWEDRNVSITGVAKMNNLVGDAKLLVEFPDYRGKPAIYWVLGTDYKSYSVVWSCEGIGGMHLRFVWILTREQQPVKEVTDKAFEVLKNSNITRRYMTRTDQKNCKARDEDDDLVDNI